MPPISLLSARRTFAALFCFTFPLLVNATTVSAVRHPQAQDAAPQRSVVLRGVVTAFSGWNDSFFLQDKTGGISVDRREQTPVHTGDDVEVSGTVEPGSFAPIVVSTAIRVLGKGDLPTARASTYDELSSGVLDSERVELSGVIQSARMEEIWGKPVLFVGLRTPGGFITAHVVNFAQGDFADLLDSKVRVRGVCGTVFNGRHQLVGVRLFVPELSDIQVESRSVELSRLPLTSLANLLRFDPDFAPDHRVRTVGTVTFQAPGGQLYLEDDGAGICVRTRGQAVFAPGTRLEVFGFVGADGYSMTLDNAIVRRIGSGPEPQPIGVRAKQMIVEKKGFADAPYDGLLVRIEGKLVERLPQTNGQLWMLEQDHVRFQAELGESGKATQIEPGSMVALTGICRIEADEHHDPKAFRILLRTRSDVTVLRNEDSRVSVTFLAVALLFVLSASLLIWSLQRWDLDKAQEARNARGTNREASMWARISKWISIVVAGAGAAMMILPDSLGLNHGEGLALMAAAVALRLANDKQGGVARILAESVCAALAAVIGCLAIIDSATGRKSALDMWLQPGDAGRLPLAAATALFLLGCALLMLRYKRLTGLAQAVTLLTGALCVLGLNSCMYGIHDFPGIAVYAGMGLASASSLFVLTLGVLCCYPDRGPMKSISARASGGLMVRRMLPCALVAPSVLGWVRWKIQLLGFYDTAFGLALFTSVNALSFASLLWSSAALLNRLDLSRARAEREIREREEQFRTLLESAPDAMVMLSGDGRVLMVNAQAEQIFGYSRAEMLLETVDKLIPGRFRQDISDRGDEAEWHSQQMGVHEDMQARRKDGTEFAVEISLSPIRTARGRVIATAVRDITVRKQVEAQLLESEQLYRTAIESLPQIVWTCLPDGKVDFASSRWSEYTGLPEERRLDPGAWLEQVHPEDRERAGVEWRTSLRDATRFDDEYRIRSVAGEYRWFRVISVPVRDAWGHLARWFGTSTDVDDYKRAEAEIRSFNETLETRVAERTVALRDSEERFRSIVDGVRDYSIIALDPEGRLTTWNSGAERQNGYRADEILGEHFSLFYTTEDRARDLPAEHLQTAERDGESRIEGWRLRKDGSRFFANVLITAVRNEDGTLRGFSKITRNVSEQKRAEELLQSRNVQLAEMNAELSTQTERAEKAANAKSEFLAAMSHEIRTPMNAILAMAEILWESNLNADQKQLVEVFRRNGRSLMTLINDILDFSKIESGQLELENITFDLAALVRYATDMAQVTARAKGLQLTTEISKGVSNFVIGDPTRLRQILLNLLNNAVKFTSWGHVALAVTAADPRNSNLFEFTVADTGIGIPEHKQAHIFDKFTQADSSTTRQFGGSGLGLSICRSLVDRMGGRIWVTSILGQGSTFRFTVLLEPTLSPPLSEEDLSTDGTQGFPEDTKAETPLRILVAEDRADNRLVVKLYLKGLPHSLTFAEDGEEALRLFSTGSYDLILMDLQMPVLDGVSATRAIRALELQRGLKPTPIVAVSADAGVNDKAKCLEAGFNDHFAKPISMRKFLGVIRKYSHPAAAAVADTVAVDELPTPDSVTAALKKMAPRYLESRRKDAERIVRLAAENNYDQIRDVAHQIKGSGTTYGFPDLTRLAHALEEAAELRDSLSVQTHAREMASFIQRVKASV